MRRVILTLALAAIAFPLTGCAVSAFSKSEDPLFDDGNRLHALETRMDTIDKEMEAQGY